MSSNGQVVEKLFPNTRVVAVGSGKGGVGKSTVTANLAFALRDLGYKVGILDADIYGFSIPRLVGTVGQRPTIIDEKKIAPQENKGIKVISMGSLVDEDQPLAWRGPVLFGVLEQFMKDVEWGELDYLLIDLPPGTGDVALTIMQRIPDANLVIVTTPQASAYHIAGRLGSLAKQAKISNVGVIENMAYFVCDNCDKKHYIYGENEIQLKALATNLGTEVLGSLPLRKDLREMADAGELAAAAGTEVGEEYRAIAQKLVANIDKAEKERSERPEQGQACSLSGGG